MLSPHDAVKDLDYSLKEKEASLIEEEKIK